MVFVVKLCVVIQMVIKTPEKKKHGYYTFTIIIIIKYIIVIYNNKTMVNFSKDVLV